MRLIQHDYLDDPWRMMVACVLLNRTRGATVRRILPELFDAWPSPIHLAGADATQLAGLIKQLGLSHTRSQRLVRMSQDASSGMVVGTWYGVGHYAVDSWMIFVCGAVVWPDDKELRAYMEWCALRGERPPAYCVSDDLEAGEVVRPEPLRIMRLA